jgi:hydroxymethylglutaryl-CoA reductase
MVILEEKQQLLAEVAEVDPILKRLGGGPRDLEVRLISESPIGPFLVVHLISDVRDAMGANAVNTAAERLAPAVEALTGGRVHLRILSNLADRRLAYARCTIPLETLAFGDYSAEEVRDGIIEAWGFAAVDPYRATTHNKGIMNGTWESDSNGNLVGTLEMPMAVGIVGGATRVHPSAQVAFKIMGVSTANQLAQIIVSVGLAQNLAALRALATEGIQRGHMSLHARQVAVAAGAEGVMIARLAHQLVTEKSVRVDRAQEILEEWGEIDR